MVLEPTGLAVTVRHTGGFVVHEVRATTLAPLGKRTGPLYMRYAPCCRFRVAVPVTGGRQGGWIQDCLQLGILPAPSRCPRGLGKPRWQHVPSRVAT